MVMDKAGSFSKDVHGTPKNSPRTTGTPKSDHSEISGELGENDVNVGAEEPSLESNDKASLAEILDEVDRFLESLSLAGEDDPESDPSCVHVLSSLVLTMIADFGKFGAVPENDTSLLEALERVAELAGKLGKFSSLDSALNEASLALQKAMSFLDEEFRSLLEEAKPVERPDSTEKQCNDDRCVIRNQSQEQDDDQTDQLPVLISDQDDQNQIPPEMLSKLTVLAKAMISAGYEAECSMSYNVARRSAFRSELDKLGYDGISIDDVQRMPWETLEGEIAKWIAIVRACSSSLFPFEHNLSKAVFSGGPTATTLFTDLSRSVVIRLLNFADAVVLTKRSAEKLFKFLDMYEALRDLENSIDEMASETAAAKARLGEAAASIFCDLENSIKSETGRTPVPSGAVHPLTRYVMNYLKYACEYKDTLEQVFNDGVGICNDEESEEHDERSPTTHKTSPFSRQLESVMSLLDANLDAKSKLYRDLSLSYIFLMNNGRYIVQKIKSSTEIHQLMGDTWCRKRSSDLRQYHKNYQRETLGKILQCLGHEGLQVNGKVSKPVLKERFKSFNAMFEEIHKTQSAWVVSDEQLQSELRVSVSAVMIPAYRSFLGRFKQYLDSGRQTEKYIKYQPEDIETMIDELFDGNPASMIRRRN